MPERLSSVQESRITIQGIELALACPDELSFRWIGQRDVLEQLLASWIVIDKKDIRDPLFSWGLMLLPDTMNGGGNFFMHLFSDVFEN